MTIRLVLFILGEAGVAFEMIRAAFGHCNHVYFDHTLAGVEGPFCPYDSSSCLKSYTQVVTRMLEQESTQTHIQASCIFTWIPRACKQPLHLPERGANTQWAGAATAGQGWVKLVYMESYAHKKSKVPCGGDSVGRIRKALFAVLDRANELAAGSGDVTL